MRIPFRNTMPKVGKDTKIFPNATLMGNVTLGERCVVFPGAVLRSDREEGTDPILIGDETNLQDNVSVHVSFGYGVTIGSRTTVGHGAILHGCTVGDETLIGMGAIVQNGAKIGNHCLIGSGALIPGGMVVPDGHLAYGVPAKVVRPLKEEEIQSVIQSYRNYQAYAAGYIEAESGEEK